MLAGRKSVDIECQKNYPTGGAAERLRAPQNFILDMTVLQKLTPLAIACHRSAIEGEGALRGGKFCRVKLFSAPFFTQPISGGWQTVA